MSATEHVECDDDKGGYKAGLLCHGRVPDGIFWLVPQEPVVVFVVIPWTVLLLIRRSRHIDSEAALGQSAVRRHARAGIVVVVVVVNKRDGTISTSTG
jgi:hypothetical protein